MIGVKTLAASALAVAIVGVAAARGLLDPSYTGSLSAASCLVVGMFAALAAALIAVGWRPGERSGVALALRCMRLERVPADREARELPAAAQHVLFGAAAACVALAAFTNQATERLTGLPAALAAPSRSETCPPEVDATVAAPAPATPPPELPGCALVRRAVQLGYAKSLGSCAPGTVAGPTAVARAAPCTRRQRDEPILHFASRRVVDQLGALAEADPVEAAASGARGLRLKLDHLETLAAPQRQAVAATRHASHHLWLNLPAPERVSWLRALVDPPGCAARYERLPLWRSWADDEEPTSALVDHVIGQLLFATGFGVAPAQCGDYTVHWNAPADSCRRLVADPIGFLDESGALESVRDVLDRHRSRLELGRLDRALGRRPTVDPPPEPRSLVSLQCFVVDPAAPVGATVTGREVRVDGQAIPVRELRVRAVRVAGGGPIDVHDHVARLLAGGGVESDGGIRRSVSDGVPSERRSVSDGVPSERRSVSDGVPSERRSVPDGVPSEWRSVPDGVPLVRRLAPQPGAADLAAGDYLLARLDHLRDADPFAGVRWPLERADLVEVYPFYRHLHRFVDDFRRRYWAQRGRL